MNLPTAPTQGPSRTPAGARGNFVVSRVRSFSSECGESAPAGSGITPEMSAMLPSASTRPGRSAPAEPKRTNFKTLSSGRRKAGRTDGFELFVGEDEFLVPERFGLRKLAAGNALHEVEDLATHIVELRAVQDAAGIHVHVVRHAFISIRIRTDFDDRRDRRAYDGAPAGGEENQMRAARDQFND